MNPQRNGQSAEPPVPARRVRLVRIEEAGAWPESCLLIDTFGALLGKHGERLRVLVRGEVVAERPLLGLEHVLVLTDGAALSTDAIRACAERGIPISLVSRSGRPYAKLLAPELTGTVQTRRQQLLAYLDQRGVHLAKAFASAKLRNQAALLKYMAKYRQRVSAAIYELAREAAFRCEDYARRVEELAGACVDALRVELMNLEAQGAKHYWEAARLLVRPDLDWPRRETRGAPDLVNQLLNYGYGILYAQIERAVLLAGLDPYAGFLHEDRPGKPSLVLDLIEEFRQMVVDRCVFALLNQRVPLAQDEAGRLDQATRITVARRVNERLETEEPYEGRRLRVRSIVQAQARRIATYVRGDGPPYEPWIGRW
ncbi:MAG TPA: CRISPR-associated endonuclease Cas1 [Chloroflexota bacterium]|nr:CRISPR-associated endonuclease Cas1 [Chloroflexota bacterium]